MDRTNSGLFLLLLWQLTPVPAAGQIEVLRGIDRVIQATEARENRQGPARDAAEEQRQMELETRRQQEQIRNNPGSFPRERLSNEAVLSNNPWARDAQRRRELRVELFTAEGCDPCQKMEDYLNDVGVPYARQFLQPGSEAEQIYLTQIGRGTIPVVRVNGRLIRGYEPEEVRRIVLEEKQLLEQAEGDVQ
jgi:glutaredoxin